MILRDHPKLKPWPPTSGFACPACPGPTPSENEVGGIILRNVVVSTAAAATKLILILDYKGGDCEYVLECDDRQFARSLYETLKSGRGQSLQRIGDFEINYCDGTFGPGSTNVMSDDWILEKLKARSRAHRNGVQTFWSARLGSSG